MILVWQIAHDSPNSPNFPAIRYNELPLEEIKGFVTAVYNDQWWIGCVLHKDQDTRTIKSNFLCPQGPSHSFKYPVHEAYKIYW